MNLRIHALALLLMSCAGCASLEDQHYRNVNRLRACVAWHSAKKCVPECSDNKDFACGWKDGFYEVSTGGCGDAPAVPPPCYWSPKYQGPEGRAAIDQYYQGWQTGVICAEQRDLGRWHDIPVRRGVVVECPTDCENGDACFVAGTDNGMVPK